MSKAETIIQLAKLAFAGYFAVMVWKILMSLNT